MFSDPEKNVSEFGFIPGQTVVDLGSGAGHYSLALSKVVGASGHVYCVDIKKDMLVKLKNQARVEGLDNLEVIWGDVEKSHGTKLRDNLADGVVLSNTLSLLADELTAILEAKRITKNGGKICVIEWLERIKQEELKKMFIEADLNFDRAFDAGEHHYGLLFKK